MSAFSELRGSRELLINLTQREIKGKYKRTVLGQLWSLANPIASMLIYSLVFSFLLRVAPPTGNPSGIDSYPLWLLAGLLPWGFFVAAAKGGMGSILSNAGLIKKVFFPRSVLVLAAGASHAYTWMFEMAVLVIVLSIVGAFVLPWIPVVLFFMVMLAAFATGLGFLLAIVNVHFRDTEHLVGIVFQVWMYLTPIIYPISFMRTQSDAIGPLFAGVTLIDLFRLNPMERFVAVFRALLYDNRWPDLDDSVFCIVVSLVMLMIGYTVFSRNSKRLAELL